MSDSESSKNPVNEEPLPPMAGGSNPCNPPSMEKFLEQALPVLAGRLEKSILAKIAGGRSLQQGMADPPTVPPMTAATTSQGVSPPADVADFDVASASHVDQPGGRPGGSQPAAERPETEESKAAALQELIGFLYGFWSIPSPETQRSSPCTPKCAVDAREPLPVPIDEWLNAELHKPLQPKSATSVIRPGNKVTAIQATHRWAARSYRLPQEQYQQCVVKPEVDDDFVKGLQFAQLSPVGEAHANDASFILDLAARLIPAAALLVWSASTSSNMLARLSRDQLSQHDADLVDRVQSIQDLSADVARDCYTIGARYNARGRQILRDAWVDSMSWPASTANAVKASALSGPSLLHNVDVEKKNRAALDSLQTQQQLARGSKEPPHKKPRTQTTAFTFQPTQAQQPPQRSSFRAQSYNNNNSGAQQDTRKVTFNNNSNGNSYANKKGGKSKSSFKKGGK